MAAVLPGTPAAPRPCGPGLGTGHAQGAWAALLWSPPATWHGPPAPMGASRRAVSCRGAPICAAGHLRGDLPCAPECSAALLIRRPWDRCPLPTPLPTRVRAGRGHPSVSAEPRCTGILTSGGLRGQGRCPRKVAQLALGSQAGSAQAVPPAPQPGASLGSSGPAGRGADTAFQGQGRWPWVRVSAVVLHSSPHVFAFPPACSWCANVEGGAFFHYWCQQRGRTLELGPELPAATPGVCQATAVTGRHHGTQSLLGGQRKGGTFSSTLSNSASGSMHLGGILGRSVLYAPPGPHSSNRGGCL